MLEPTNLVNPQSADFLNNINITNYVNYDNHNNYDNDKI